MGKSLKIIPRPCTLSLLSSLCLSLVAWPLCFSCTTRENCLQHFTTLAGKDSSLSWVMRSSQLLTMMRKNILPLSKMVKKHDSEKAAEADQDDTANVNGDLTTVTWTANESNGTSNGTAANGTSEEKEPLKETEETKEE